MANQARFIKRVGMHTLSLDLPVRGRGHASSAVPGGYPYDAYDLDFTNPVASCHSKPLPMVAHLNYRGGKLCESAFLAVKEEGAVPVFHRNSENDMQRYNLAKAAAVAARENAEAEIAAVEYHMQHRRMSEN